MKVALAALAATACSSTPAPGGGPDGSVDVDAPRDASPDMATGAGFGTLTGMCGVLTSTELLGASPLLVQDELTFARAFVDPADRPLLTAGGMQLIATPNAGGSSEMSELFAYEQLARCEQATLLKTETAITYQDAGGKKTDMLVELDGHKIGVSVTRAFAYPIGATYTMQQAEMLLERKLDDIQLSSANVTPADAWEKQILAYLAIDAQAAQMLVTVWDGLPAQTKADTILLVTTTSGDDLFIYQN